MDGDQLRAQILRDVRQFGRVQAAMIPTHPHLHGHWYVHRLDRRLDQRSGQRQVAHQCAARVAIDDLLDRAAHIDIDDRRTAIGVQLGGLGHFGR